METMTETGTEKRVDELSKRVDFGFEQLSKRMDLGFEHVDQRFEQVDRRFDGSERSAGERNGEVNQRFLGVEGEIRELRADMKTGFDSLQRLMIQCFAGTLGSIIAGGVVLFLSHS